ncbi:MAG: OmpA family protein [Owenweeksia sp.]|nr:OmpA family protein [Owenweeksia sp.]
MMMAIFILLSDGLPGMGGLDIFRIKLDESGMPAKDAEAQNMKFPINTNWDDFDLVFKEGGDDVGYISSNRKGSKSDDIYSVVKVPLVFTLEGVVTSSKTKQPIGSATIKLDGSDGTSIETTADEDGYYLFETDQIARDVQYTLSFQKEGFLTNTGNVTTIGVDLTSFEYVPSETHFLNKLRLNKELDPIEEPIVLPNVFFDLAQAKLRPESKAALDSVVTILDNNPTIVIELRSHTDYRDSEASNQGLSQRRADSSVTYLIKKGVDSARLVSKGMGESEPFTIPENYDGYGAEQMEPGKTLTESYIKSLSPEKQEIANQINRRTDFKVLRDDYVPAGGVVTGEGVDTKDIIAEKREEAKEPGEIYVLDKPENLARVARKLDMSYVDLKRLNGGLRGVRPFKGLQLKAEKDGNYEQWDATHYQVQRRGQDLKDIAKKLDLDKKDLEELNPEWENEELQPGLWVRTKK